MGRLLTVSQAGAVLDMSERTVRRLIATGALATARVGRRVFVTRSSVLALAGVGVG
ncbi:MAG: helix-turn-helix domain-containing protein [Collinsella sp.]